MTIDEAEEKLQASIYQNLVMNSPILSGNMKSFIRLGEFGSIIISAPFYDEKLWKTKKQIVHTGKTINGYTDYAEWVNDYGGYFTHNKSEHWVNRTINQCCEQIAKEIGGVVINKLPE